MKHLALFNINYKNLNSFTLYVLEETHFFKGNSNLEREKIGKV